LRRITDKKEGELAEEQKKRGRNSPL